MITLRIGQTVERVNTPEYNTRFTITTPEQLAYHNEFLSTNYKYILIEDTMDDSFDLPEVVSAPAKPRIHTAGEDSTCVSCEG